MSNTILFPSPEQRRGWGEALTALLAEAELRVGDGPVPPRFDRTRFADELAAFDFAQPVPFEELMAWTVAQLEHGVTHMTHPRYLGLFNPAPSFPAQCADRISASFNPQLASQTTSPVAVAIEAHVIRGVARRAGLPVQSVGHFTSGGSEANGTALICALTRAEPGFATRGSRAFRGAPVFYVSEDCHLAWVKLAHMSGIGRDAVHFIPTDNMGRMRSDALAATIATDRRAGSMPVMVVATAGTTAAGMIDPVTPCAMIAQREGLWFHVDAAWAGGAIASDRLRPLLAGIEAADSITIDAHKWFATTMGSGMFLTRHAEALANAFAVATTFMPSQAAELDPYMTSAQWSRRFTGLRLFLSLAAGGWAAHAAHVEHSVDLAHELAGRAILRGWNVVNEPKLAVVCLAPPDGSPPVRDIVAHVLRDGSAWLSAAKFAGRDVVRACVTHGETSGADIAIAIAALEKARLDLLERAKPREPALA
ncbi:MAG TPA: pyridoxal-dependent decarboxylase [Stellaceae bacterium]|nr:pyridoxal-dependent decarboxylase [Stellaceae bacterium]